MSNIDRDLVNQNLIKNVFYDLENLNSGFDAESIVYFSEVDFQLVLNRVEELGIGITGIEPWKNGEFYDVITNESNDNESTDSKWYLKAFDDFKKMDNELQYAASYELPDYLLKSLE